MPGPGWSVYTAPESELTGELLDTFLAEQLRERVFIESMTLEIKRERRRHNVADAVCALANSAGGLVLVGVDEDEPTLASAPGVDPNEVVALSDHLRGALGPLVRPEIISVPIGAGGNVVVVLRVEADPNVWPVVSNGRVMLRNPGQSVAATREQILDLARRRGTNGPPGETAYALSSFTPTVPTPEEALTRGDLLFRLATAVYARPRLGAPQRIGSDERQRLYEAFSQSSFGRLFDEPRPRGSSRRRPDHLLAPQDFSSGHFVASVDIEDDGQVDRLTLKVTRQGNQFAVVLEAEARRPGPQAAGASRPIPRVSREELAYVAICGVESLSLDLVPALVELIGGAPLHLDDVYLWAQSPAASQGLSSVLSTFRASRPVASARSTWGTQVRLVADLDDAVQVLGPVMETFYIDIGLDDERELVKQDLAEGRRLRDYQE